MKKLSYLIVLALILGLVLTGCSLLSNISQVPATDQSGITYLTKHTADDPQVIDLLAGQTEKVGEVEVWNDEFNLYVKYIITDLDWCLTETHLHVATSLGDIPQKNGNPPPGKFDYKEEHDCLADYTYTIPLTWVPGTELFIATHAVVKKETITFDTCMIDFEEFSEYNLVSSVLTDCGEVTFGMVDYNPLMNLSVGETATLTVKDDLPIIAEELTMDSDYYGLVAFTSNSNGMKDDLVLDDAGTGAGGKMLTDALDYSQIPLLYHAYTKYQAILVNVSNVLNVDTLNFVGIDLDHNELWHFQYFDENDVLIADVTVGPGTSGGDGKAYPTFFTDSRISKVAIWGEQNQKIPDRLGFAIDNIKVTTKTVTVQEETAWGAGFDFPGKNWATYFTYTVQLPQDGMVLWLDAGEGTTHGSEVSEWKDQSVNGNDAEQASIANQPTYITNGPNNLPAVHFDGVDDHLIIDDLLAGGESGRTIFIVAKSDTSNVGNKAIFALNGNVYGSTSARCYSITSEIYVRVIGNMQFDESFPNDFAILTIGNAENAKVNEIYGWLDGIPLTTKACSNCNDILNIQGTMSSIGALVSTASTAYAWDGDIAEIIVYNRALSDSERGFVETYLKVKYDL